MWGELCCRVRGILQCTMATHQILLRGAAQCHLLHAAMNLVDVVSASPLRVCPSFRAGGCAEVDVAGLEPCLSAPG